MSSLRLVFIWNVICLRDSLVSCLYIERPVDDNLWDVNYKDVELLHATKKYTSTNDKLNILIVLFGRG